MNRGEALGLERSSLLGARADRWRQQQWAEPVGSAASVGGHSRLGNRDVRAKWHRRGNRAAHARFTKPYSKPIAYRRLPRVEPREARKSTAFRAFRLSPFLCPSRLSRQARPCNFTGGRFSPVSAPILCTWLTAPRDRPTPSRTSSTLRTWLTRAGRTAQLRNG